MVSRRDENGTGVLALELFRPRPRVLYNLDATAMLSGVTRRAILMYCRSGFLTPSFQSPYGAMVFTQDAIHTVRRMEQVRAAHGFELAWLEAIFDAFDELELLHADWCARRGT
jgi:DNA-binding transcriptional MerR regulator